MGPVGRRRHPTESGEWTGAWAEERWLCVEGKLEGKAACMIVENAQENATLFSRDSSDLERTDVVRHRVITGSAKLIKQLPRRLPLAKRDEAFQAVDKMLKIGVIEP